MVVRHLQDLRLMVWVRQVPTMLSAKLHLHTQAPQGLLCKLFADEHFPAVSVSHRGRLDHIEHLCVVFWCDF